jgi:hypothetical protein
MALSLSLASLASHPPGEARPPLPSFLPLTVLPVAPAALGLPVVRPTTNTIAAAAAAPAAAAAAAAATTTTPNSFARIVRTAISAGGCSASRAAIVGALSAASHGVRSIPLAWIKKTKCIAEVLSLARDVLAALGGPAAASAVNLADELQRAVAPPKAYVPKTLALASGGGASFDFFAGTGDEDEGACAT